jgi:hypothetical protein
MKICGLWPALKNFSAWMRMSTVPCGSSLAAIFQPRIFRLKLSMTAWR